MFFLLLNVAGTTWDHHFQSFIDSALNITNHDMDDKELIEQHAMMNSTYSDQFSHFISSTPQAHLLLSQEIFKQSNSILGPFKTSPTMLDFGCGTGMFVEAARKTGTQNKRLQH